MFESSVQEVPHKLVAATPALRGNPCTPQEVQHGQGRSRLLKRLNPEGHCPTEEEINIQAGICQCLSASKCSAAAAAFATAAVIVVSAASRLPCSIAQHAILTRL
jgi:hypothetical protein